MATERQKEVARQNIVKARQAQSARAHGSLASIFHAAEASA
jgi:hypothetical protein